MVSAGQRVATGQASGAEMRVAAEIAGTAGQARERSAHRQAKATAAAYSWLECPAAGAGPLAHGKSCGGIASTGPSLAAAINYRLLIPPSITAMTPGSGLPE
jgi:hypothetical protein